MPKYLSIVYTKAAPGRDVEFNGWYDKQHIHDVLSVPGYKTGQRLKLAAKQFPGMDPEWPYVAIYEIEADNLQAVYDVMVARTGTDKMPLTDALGGFKMEVFEAMGQKVAARQ